MMNVDLQPKNEEAREVRNLLTVETVMIQKEREDRKGTNKKEK